MRPFALTLCLLVCACGPSQSPPPDQPAAAPPEKATPEKPSPRTGGLTTWGIQLQAADLPRLAAKGLSLLVTDHSRDGSEAGRFQPWEIQVAHSAGTKVLSYLSIGEAEDYRFYWSPDWNAAPPSFLGPANPDWPGAYKVRYWEEAWWEAALRPYLDKILETGFDGVFLDIVDGYWFWGQNGEDPHESADRMVRLVSRIAAYGRERTGGRFIVCPQNALGILDDASPAFREQYLATIDLIGVESVFYNFESPEDQAYRLRCLTEFGRADKTVLDIEYIGADRLADYREKIRTALFRALPFAANPDRALKDFPDQGR